MANFINSALSKLFGNKSVKDIKAIQPLVNKINEEYEKLHDVSIDELRGRTTYFRERIKEHLSDIQQQIDDLKAKAEQDPDMDVHEKEIIYQDIDKLISEKDDSLEDVLNEILPEAFAIVRETCLRFKTNSTLTGTATELDKKLEGKKDYINIDGEKVTWQNSWIAAGNRITWDMVHYDVQLIGGVVLHQGKIAEMATGEGKTLVATLPAYLNALSGDGVHIVTVNNYLAQRDSEWMGPIFEFLGITVDCIDKHQPSSEERRNAYNAGITYGTNNEFGFDYLRDNMVHFKEDMVQRKHHYAMVDEVDSVLVDDARTPLIISGPVAKGDEQEFHSLKPRIQKIVEAQRKLVNNLFMEAKKQIQEGKDGERDGGLALLRAQRGLPKYKPLIKYLSEPGIKSKLLKTEAHYMRDQSKEMPFVDQGLYFTIDEKNNQVELTDMGIELITGEGEDSDFFVMPDVGAEIAEIEKNITDEQEKIKRKDRLMQDFSIKSERLHSVQQLLKAYTLFENDVEYVVMDGKVKIVDEQTGRIMEGRRYSDGLHQAIEAKENVKVEAATQTYATVTLQNFFRMYHKLSGMTGTAETEAGELWEIYKLDVVVIPTNVPVVRDDRDDLIFKTVKEKFRAVIEQIEEFRDQGRPILVGTTSVEVSELLSRMLKMKGIPHNVLNAKQHQREAEIVAEAGHPGKVTIATNMAGRGTDIKLSKEVKEAGGLAIVGTERHESRRIDRQLRGRAGRQGDPGTSQFYVSLEDNLMRIFVSDKVAKVMDRMGYKEGEVIQHSWISKSIERAQKKVEENNFGVRKRLLEYDDVMNSQRELIYKKRRHALFGERLSVDLDNTVYETAEELVNYNKAAEDYENFQIDCMRIFSMESPFDEQYFTDTSADKLTQELYKKAKEYYKRKSGDIIKTAYPVIKDVYEKRGDTVTNIIVPFTDGKRMMNVRENLERIVNSNGRELISGFEKSVTLALIDDLWKDHLRQMDELKQSVQSAVYEQKDPLLIYKFEAFELFKVIINEINKDIVSFLYRGLIPVERSEEVQQAGERKKASMTGLQTSRVDNAMPGSAAAAAANASGGENKPQPVRVENKVGRNDPCPCGSGKKYKKCHGAPGKVAQS